MGYEIDYLPVGDGSRSGDAIALRYGNLYGSRSEQRVVVVDGGFTDDGEALVEHIRRYYGTSRVDVVISTHPDQDHVTGLGVVLEELEVGELWMHLPWNHSPTVEASRRAGFQGTSLSEPLTRSLQGASDLEAIARRRGVPIVEPFTGIRTGDGCLTVVGPSIEYYEALLKEFPEMPAKGAYLDRLLETIKKAVRMVSETLWHETLGEDGETSPQNNSSVITHLHIDGRQLLLTADAGIPAISRAISVLELDGFQAGQLSFVQVPHHGSRRNVSPSLLDRLLGQKGQETTHGTAFVSAAEDGSPKHPAKKVTNAFRRRGYNVVATQGSTKQYSHDAPPREGWGPAEPVPFFDEVEEDDS